MATNFNVTKQTLEAYIALRVIFEINFLSSKCSDVFIQNNDKFIISPYLIVDLLHKMLYLLAVFYDA